MQVKRKAKHPPKEKTDDKEKKEKFEEDREELDFQFDEEINVPAGRVNAFTDWCVKFIFEILPVTVKPVKLNFM